LCGHVLESPWRAKRGHPERIANSLDSRAATRLAMTMGGGLRNNAWRKGEASVAMTSCVMPCSRKSLGQIPNT